MKFIAQMGDPVIKPDHVVIKLKASADQLPSVVGLSALTGAGDPKLFTLKVAAKGVAGFTAEGSQLWSIKINHEGDSVTTIRASGFDAGVLTGLVGDKNVAVAAVAE